MRTDTEKLEFTAIGQGVTIAILDTSSDTQIAFAVDIDSIAGAPTNFRILAAPFDDQNLGSSTEFLRKTVDITAPGVYLLGTRGTGSFEPAIESAYKKIRVFTHFTGGTSPTVTGFLYVTHKQG